MVLFGCGVARADLMNGAFTDGPDKLDNWFTDGEVAVAGPSDAANLDEGDFVLTFPGLLEQTFTLTNDPISLSFDFQMDFTFGGPVDPNRIFDDFVDVALIPSVGGPLFGGFDTFMTYDDSGVLDNFGGGVVGAGIDLTGRYTLDLTGLGLVAGDELTLSFLLVQSDDGKVSTGLVDNIQLVQVPAPSAALLAAMGLMSIPLIRRRRA
ncbi:MAG: hypothetical protein C4547_00940 [Phycisphaerales bacterium]|nr:MAG: hypothetical protein C4547_00940 [Phycisphaerales bacterium]